jgi:hypothetical protein
MFTMAAANSSGFSAFRSFSNWKGRDLAVKAIMHHIGINPQHTVFEKMRSPRKTPTYCF